MKSLISGKQINLLSNIAFTYCNVLSYGSSECGKVENFIQTKGCLREKKCSGDTSLCVPLKNHVLLFS